MSGDPVTTDMTADEFEAACKDAYSQVIVLARKMKPRINTPEGAGEFARQAGTIMGRSPMTRVEGMYYMLRILHIVMQEAQA
jgi:hypothetical protein